MARRKKYVPAAPPGSLSAPPKAPWYKRAWVIAAAFGSVAFTLGMDGPTLLQNIRKLPTEVEATHDQYVSWLKEDAEWTGDWSNFPEGINDMADMRLSEGIDLKISLQAKNGELSGMITAGTVCSNVPFDFLLLRGSVTGTAANVEVWDIDGGHQRVFEHLKLVRDGNVITVHPLGGETNWFPQGARIGKHTDANDAFMNGFCQEKRRPRTGQ